MEGRDESKPFFLYLSMAEPHTVIENPPAFNELYSNFTNGPIIPITSASGGIPKNKLVARGPGEYYANITYMDAQLGRVLKLLKDLSIDEETVVVFASDNGPVTSNWINWWEVNAYGETGGLRGRKHFLYEGGIKVPAIVRYPGVTTPGTESNELIVGTDFFATLAKIGGGDIPTDRPIDSLDIRPVLAGGKMPSRSAFWALSSESNLEFAVRQGQWKLLLDSNKEARELYNLDEDPLELFNLLKVNPRMAQQLNDFFTLTLSSIEADPFRPQQKPSPPLN